MSKLTDKIQKASQQYYSDGSSSLSDEEFDKLIGQLKVEDPQSPLLDTGHGYDVSKTYGKKVNHKYGLVGSLDKCHSWIEMPKKLKDSIAQNDAVYSLKLDGLSVVLYYKDGKLDQAVTRGNGFTGIDVTDKVKAIFMNQCSRIPTMDGISLPKFTGSIRGEILMSNANFAKFQSIHSEAKNSRNSAAGIINSKEITSDINFLNLIVYRVTGLETEFYSLNSEYTSILYELEHNFASYDDNGEQIGVVPFTFRYRDNCSNNFDSDMKYLKEKWYSEWPADGIVVSSNKVDIFPTEDSSKFEVAYDSIAYKYPSEVKESTVVDVLWEMSKTNYLIPRIQMEPVNIAGSIVQFCTGIHAQAIQTSGVGPGSKIKITKANEIIPQMLEVINQNPVELPKTCPECGEKLIWNGVHLQCPNRTCPNLQRQDVLCWFNSLAPLDGLGDTLILKYMEEIFGDDISIEKIYENGKLVNESTSVQKNLFIKAYNKLFEGPIRLEDAIRATNIPRFGDITASKCTKYAPELKKLLDERVLSSRLKELGAANYESLADNAYHKFSRLNFIKDLIDWDVADVPEKGEICITGKLSVKRSEFEKELKAAGFTVSGSAKKTTKYLITDDPDSGTSKNAAAIKYNIPRISENEFRKTVLNK